MLRSKARQPSIPETHHPDANPRHRTALARKIRGIREAAMSPQAAADARAALEKLLQEEDREEDE